MPIFNKVFQKLLSETDDILQKEKKERLISVEDRLEKNINLNFRNYAVKNDYDYIEEENYEENTEEDDDETNYRDKDKERSKQEKLDYINKIKKQALKKIEELKKQGVKSSSDVYGVRTSERNLHREVGGMEIDYELVDKIEQEKGQTKKKRYKKYLSHLQTKVKTVKAMRSLASFGLNALKKRLILIKAKKMFKGLLTTKQINSICKGQNINIKKLKKVRAKIVMINKEIKKQITNISKNSGFVEKINKKILLEKEQKKKTNGLIKGL